MFCSLFSPKPARSRSLPSRASFSTSATVAALKFFQRRATFLGPRDCRLRSSRSVAGYFFQKFLTQAVVALAEDFLDVLGHALADAGQFFEFFGVLGELRDGFGEPVDEFGGLFVAAVAADDGAIDFKELRGLAQDAGNLLVVHAGIIRRMGEEGGHGQSG